MDDYKIVRQKVSENFDGWPEEDLGTPENGCHKDESIKGPPRFTTERGSVRDSSKEDTSS
jgi:hypothetical protein